VGGGWGFFWGGGKKKKNGRKKRKRKKIGFSGLKKTKKHQAPLPPPFFFFFLFPLKKKKEKFFFAPFWKKSPHKNYETLKKGQKWNLFKSPQKRSPLRPLSPKERWGEKKENFPNPFLGPPTPNEKQFPETARLGVWGKSPPPHKWKKRFFGPPRKSFKKGVF